MSPQVLPAYVKARQRLFLLDYDGTLAQLAPLPELAKPTPKLLALLARLTADADNTVVIVSGRPRQTLDDWLGDLPVNLIAEHGFFTKKVGQDWQSAKPEEQTWKEGVRTLMEQTAHTVPGSFVEEKSSALVWHYRQATEEDIGTKAELLISKLQPLAKANDLVAVPGHMIVEVRVGGVNKGLALKPWLADQTWDFILAAGDDATDEDIFAALPASAFAIKVGPGESKADLRVSSPTDLLDLLDSLPA
jgi:trehalose 6-phosphate synthase/phosphatase